MIFLLFFFLIINISEFSSLVRQQSQEKNNKNVPLKDVPQFHSTKGQGKWSFLQTWFIWQFCHATANQNMAIYN